MSSVSLLLLFSLFPQICFQAFLLTCSFLISLLPCSLTSLKRESCMLEQKDLRMVKIEVVEEGEEGFKKADQHWTHLFDFTYHLCMS